MGAFTLPLPFPPPSSPPIASIAQNCECKKYIVKRRRRRRDERVERTKAKRLWQRRICIVSGA